MREHSVRKKSTSAMLRPEEAAMCFPFSGAGADEGNWRRVASSEDAGVMLPVSAVTGVTLLSAGEQQAS